MRNWTVILLLTASLHGLHSVQARQKPTIPPTDKSKPTKESSLKAIWAEFQVAVQAGKLSQDQANVAMAAVKKALLTDEKGQKKAGVEQPIDDRTTSLETLRELSKTLPKTSTGEDEEGPAATGLFGWAANATHRFMDNSHKGEPRKIHGISFRLDYRDHNTIGRTWDKVKIRIAHGDWKSIQHNKSKEFKLKDDAILAFDKAWSFPTLKGFPVLKPDVWGGPQNCLNFQFDKPFAYNGKDAIFVEFVFEGGKAEDGRNWEGDLPYGFEYYLDSMPSVGGWRMVEENARKGGLYQGKARVEAVTSYTAGGQSVWTTAPKGMPFLKWDFKK